MKKNSSYHSLWLPIVVTIVATIGVFVFAEYVFHIPSRFFGPTETEVSPPDTDWTPRTPIVVPPPPLTTTGTAEAPPEPTICTMEYAPVCGADGRDYSNACMARAGGTTVVSEGNCKNVVTPVATGSETPPSETGSEVKDLSLFDTGSYHIYENKSFGYSLALPKFAYYQGVGARDGSSHALVVGITQTGAEDTATSDIIVYFYKTEPATPPIGEKIGITSGTIYLVSRSSGPKIDKIIEAIKSSIQ